MEAGAPGGRPVSRVGARTAAAERIGMALRCAGTPGRRPVARVGAPPAAAEPIGMAIDGGGCARRATRFARRRATSRCRTYRHGDSWKRARSAGDPFRASARAGQRTRFAAPMIMALHGAGTPGGRPVPRVGAPCPCRAYPAWRCAERVRRAGARVRVGAPRRGSGHVQGARAFRGFPPNTPCSRPRWRGRQPGRESPRSSLSATRPVLPHLPAGRLTVAVGWWLVFGKYAR
jgi:hypothetical protein